MSAMPSALGMSPAVDSRVAAHDVSAAWVNPPAVSGRDASSLVNANNLMLRVFLKFV